MLIFFKKYSNSVIATTLSFIGTAIAALGTFTFFQELFSGITDEIYVWVVLVLLGLCLCFLAKHVGEKKNLKVLIKRVKENNLEERIRNSTELAVKIYENNRSNAVLKYISSLNPAAGQIIKQNKATNKK